MSKQDRETREIQEWTKMKSLGKKKYIWIEGVIKSGLFIAICMTFTLQTIDEGFNFYSFSNYNFIRRLIISLIIFPIGGYTQSVLLWRKYEKKYNT